MDEQGRIHITGGKSQEIYWSFSKRVTDKVKNLSEDIELDQIIRIMQEMKTNI